MALQIGNLQVQAGVPASIGFDITGPTGTADGVLLQFDLNGVRRTATAAAGSTSVNPVAVAGAAAGQHHDFSWDAAGDPATERETLEGANQVCSCNRSLSDQFVLPVLNRPVQRVHTVDCIVR